MPIRVEWNNSLPNVMTYDMEGQWTWAEFSAASEREFELAAAVHGQRYDLVVNFTRTPFVPNGPAISHVNRINQLREQHGGLLVVVTTNLFIFSLVKIGQKVFPVGNENMHMVRDWNEALSLIRSNRAVNGSVGLG